MLHKSLNYAKSRLTLRPCVGAHVRPHKSRNPWEMHFFDNNLITQRADERNSLRGVKSGRSFGCFYTHHPIINNFSARAGRNATRRSCYMPCDIKNSNLIVFQRHTSSRVSESFSEAARARISCNFFLMKTRSLSRHLSLALLMRTRRVRCAGVCFYYNILMRSVRRLPPSLLYIYLCE